jgi:hypothetical protein
MQQTPPLHPLYFPLSQRCSVVSAVQILPRLHHRRRYFWIDCAEIKGLPPTKELTERLAQMQRDLTKTTAQPQQKEKAGGQGQ